MIPLLTFHAVLDGPGGRGYPLNSEQRRAVDHGAGPLWLTAGPGSGKSEVLVTRTLRLLCVDGVAPASIMLTTFTVKAARSLEDRLATYLAVLKAHCPSLAAVDPSELRVGTLHGLCNDVLQEFRYADYQNVRLLDDVEQNLFMYLNAAATSHGDLAFWTHFDYAVRDWRNRTYLPSKWKRAKAAVVLFNHIVEDNVDVTRLSGVGGHWATLGLLYEQYAAALRSKHRCDFAHLQQRFLNFLTQPVGRQLIDGVSGKAPPLLHVLVDEYQDTNPLQERLYLELAQNPPHNLVVVGDDDQALYRFRGGTVAGMVNFDKACAAAMHAVPTQIPLADNYRSHGDIVAFFNGYIGSFPEMVRPGVRAPGKLPVRAKSSIAGAWPAVGWLTRPKSRDLPGAVADLIEDHLKAEGVIQDYSQCLLLFRSAKDSPGNAGPFLAALRAKGIPVYNPRSKTFMESEEVKCLLATLIHVIDLDDWHKSVSWASGGAPGWLTDVSSWTATLDNVVASNPAAKAQLRVYVDKSRAALRSECGAHPGGFLELTLHEILFHILALEPFRGWRQDPLKNMRLSKVTRLFDSYHSFNLDVLRVARSGGALEETFLGRFFHMFIDYLVETGIDDDDDDDVIVPLGQLPVMTIHQSKGLEFPFVVVAQLGPSGGIGAAQRLEHELAPFRRDLYPRSPQSPADLAVEDDIRLLYVAYSRPEYALVLVGTPDQIKNHVAAPGRDFVSFRRNVKIL